MNRNDVRIFFVAVILFIAFQGFAEALKEEGGGFAPIDATNVALLVNSEDRFKKKHQATDTLIPLNLPPKRWVEFKADGFEKPVSGIIYRGSQAMRDGMPLGGIDTGCIDLEQTGLLGLSTIFNSHVPRRGPMSLPFLGLNTGGQTWMLCIPHFETWNRWISKYPPPAEPAYPVKADLAAFQMPTASEIYYWGHYPVADLEFETTAPIKVGLRTWSPFIPGDLKNSMVPGAVFEIRLRNATNAPQKGTIAFSFPGPLALEAGSDQFSRETVDGAFQGIEVKAPLVSYALGVVGQYSRTGSELATKDAWSKINEQLPQAVANSAGTSVAVDFDLEPGTAKTVRYILSWSTPTWKGPGYNWATSGNVFTHMYDKYYPSATETAQMLAANHQTLLERIFAWQEEVYSEKSMTVWLRDCLINSLHQLAEVTMWAQAKAPLPDWVKPEDGLFGMNECPRQCPQIECIPCTFYGNVPTVYFFPELALSTLRGYKGYQYDDGRPPWVFGGCTGGSDHTDFASPTKGYQFTLNGSCYAEIFNKLWLRHGKDMDLLKEFYDSLKRTTIFTMTLRPEYGDKQIVSMPTGNGGDEWFESTPFFGMCTHVGGIHLAHLQMAQQWAEKMGDTEFARQCSQWFKGGSEAMEEHLWADTHYLLYNEPETNRSNDIIMGYQLDGEWISQFHGFDGVFDRKHARKTLKTIANVNANPELCDYGALLFADPSGGLAEGHPTGYWTQQGTHLPSVLMLSMTYMYHDQKAFGLDVGFRGMQNAIIRQSAGWDWGIVYNPERPFDSGSDYYQDMVIWSYPSALQKKDIAWPTRPGGLVDRMLKAAKK